MNKETDDVQRKLLVLAVVVIGAFTGGAILVSCRGPLSPYPDRIILVTVDTLRADHLPFFGYPRQTAPFMSELASRGVLFRRAISPMSTTAPSHASMFTGLYPIQHNVLKNGHVLNDDYVMISELLAEDYQTAAVVSVHTHFKPGNLDQGFAFFDEPSTDLKAYRPAERTIDVVLDWLKDRGRRDRFFLWVHLFDPHTTYHPPAPFDQAFADESDEQQQAFIDFLVNQQRVPLDFYDNDPATMLETIDAYDGEVLYADHELRRLFDTCQERGLNDNAVWIVTSDHGEGLGNHHWMLHSENIYNEQLHVPLIVYFNDGRGAGTEVGDLVELVDLAPTVLDLVGRDPAFPEQSKRPLARSLLPLIVGKTPERARAYAFSQRRWFRPAPAHRLNPDGTRMYGEDGEKYALQNHAYKLIHRTALDDEFFDLRNDPYEVTNLVGRGVQEEQAMRRVLLGIVETLHREGPIQMEEVDEKTRERLRSLGYVD